MTIEFVRVDAIPDDVDAIAGFAAVGDLDALPAALNARFAELAGFSGKRGELLSGSDPIGRPLVIGGLGRPDELDGRTVRRAAASIGRALQHAGSIAIVLDGRLTDDRMAGALGAEAAARAVAEGVALGVHRFAGHKSKPEPVALGHVAIVVSDAAADRGIAFGSIVAGAVAFTRDLADETPARLGAVRLGEIAHEIAAAHDLTVNVWDEHDIESERLGCLMAVNAGSTEPARLIELAYDPPGVDDPDTIVLVGKGITFDSGGLSLKRPEHMYEMKGDMGGGAAVLAVLGALPAIGPRACAWSGSSPRPTTSRGRTRPVPVRSWLRGTARRSRSSTPTPKVDSCSPTRSHSAPSAHRSRCSTSRRSRVCGRSARSTPP